MSLGHGAKRAARKAGNSQVLTNIARIGFAASGLMHLLMGYIAVRIALHHGGESDQSGAFAQLTRLPGGPMVLWAAVLGMGALGLWLLLQASLGIGSSSKKRWARSLVSAGKAAAYFALAWTALTFALHRPSSSTAATRNASGTILSLPGGQALLAIVGMATAGIGGYLVYKGVRKKFLDDIQLQGNRADPAVIALAMTGYIAKGIAIIALGVLFIVAAIKISPQDASGLDGALKSLAGLPYGQAILIAIGLGLMAYGLYSIIRARLARL
ncbi:DUF1206 domain-containing protein [Arthrobacter sp. A2-55]|uniref:DUF1206 domain-containing protein n=1 Tax=Arthrobacter sp. A2-55 TaxID=2897337 RepID=UPI0021CDD668|nr:DUF1206 domain-containing protein [Arthrobacter sp. A2-55]MCU6481037.1 DUF1206 domain-containing protein [Arthrobacter sp. A2-55]